MTDLTTWTPKMIDATLDALWTKMEIRRVALAHERLMLQSCQPGTDRARRADARITELTAELKALVEQAAPYADEYSRRPWKRYFLVTNQNGHVHRGMHCSTCFPTTTYGWLVELADCDERAMVAEYGEQACTVCFPDAPTFKGFGDGTSAVARRTAAEKAERAAEKAERARVKAEKAITDVDGGTLRLRRGEPIATLVSARNRAVELLVDILASHRGATNPRPEVVAEYLSDAEHLMRAIAAKLGRTFEDVREELEAKAAAKFRREWK